MEEKKKSRIKKIRASGIMRKIMADYFYELDSAHRGFLVYYPENHGAMLGATRTATDYIPAANAVGYSPDICSYLTSDVGAFLKKETPLSRAYEGIESVPLPDVLVYNTNQCRDVQDWFNWYARELGVPSIGITTYRNIGKITTEHLKSIAKQMEDLIPDLEEISGNTFDMDKLKHAIRLSYDCTELWKKVLETNTAVPAPISFFDETIHMAPAVVMRGTETAIEYYKVLLEELEEKAAAGDGAVEGEKYRLYWEGMPIWGKLRSLAELFIELKSAVIASTYCNSWIFDAFDPDDPFMSMARAYTEIFIVRDEDFKEKYIEKMVGKYNINGILFHDAKTCPNNSNNRYGMPQRLESRLNTPTLTINGDLNDLRCYSEEQAITNIEAFIEQLEA